jgi:hypothetical protein
MQRRHLIIALLALVVIGITAVVVFRRPGKPPATISSVPAPALGDFQFPVSPANPGNQIRPELAAALGFGEDVSWEQRLDILRKLKNPTPVENETLLVAMMANCPIFVSASFHSSYMHEIACVLQTQPGVREKFARALATLVRDKQRNSATRDYAIQHLRQVWSRAVDDSNLRAAIVSTFHEFAHHKPAIATSALLSLHLLGSPTAGSPVGSTGLSFPPGASPSSSTSYFIPESELLPLLEPVFTAKTSSDNIPSRLNAIRIVGDRRMKAFRPHLLAALKDRKEHMMIRMAAANAIGAVAEPADLESLSTFEPGDELVAAALHRAIRPRNTH